ncbi:MAG TPA: palindromic element RPE4 domain-containing protein [Rickettsia endosymbiont of Pyrocoelia pectoralis]|nr:palindromic element RPE4 domain-containing protein [Rickettsia endosymbiont of Pyrocoelia pectoralis]
MFFLDTVDKPRYDTDT